MKNTISFSVDMLDKTSYQIDHSTCSIKSFNTGSFVSIIAYLLD